MLANRRFITLYGINTTIRARGVGTIQLLHGLNDHTQPQYYIYLDMAHKFRIYTKVRK